MLPDAIPAAAAALAAVAIVVTFVADRVRARRFHELTRAAVAVSGQQLPAMIEALRSADEDSSYLTASLRPLPVPPGGDVARLTTAFNAVQETAVDLAIANASLMRKGIGGVFVDLARRNQALAELQLNVLDQLEATERDPERLARLVELDHLAARLRRNTEALLTVAGEEVTRTRGRFVAVRDLVRAAVGEAESYRNVRITDLEPAELAGAPAGDVAHVLAELLDNATRSGGVVVDIHGRVSNRGYMLSVVDRGLGMTDAQIAAANDVLSHPPMVASRTNGAVGFIVAGRLAARHGLKVRLVAGHDGGVVALVSIPKALLGAMPDAPAAPPVDEDEDWAEGWVDAPLPVHPVTYSELVAEDDLDAILSEAFGDGPFEPERDLDADPESGDDDFPDDGSADERVAAAASVTRPPLNTHHFDAGLARLIAAAKDRTR